MSYLAILATIAFFLLFILGRSSLQNSMKISILIFCLTILVTNFCFPFWKIYSPQTGVVTVFLLGYIGLPIILLNGVVLIKLVLLIKQNKNRKKEYIFMLIFVALGFLSFGFGFIHNEYQSTPDNNLNLYLKPREYIVSLIKTGKLHGEKNCLQRVKLYEIESQLYECQERIELPEKYKGLSRNGTVHLSKTSEQLSISFVHSTYGFGDGSINIVYSSLDNGLSKPKWEINPPLISNKQAKITEQKLPTETPIVTEKRDFLKQSDRPPTVNILIHPSVIKRGQEFTVTVRAKDDRGLESIWWFGEQTGDNNIDKAHWFDCNGKQSCAFNETVSTQVIGNLMLLGNARDLVYPTTGEAHQASEGEGIACATVTVTK
jgi:hypothetical protein